MKHKNIPFSPPDMSEDEINEVADTLRNGWITTGPKVKEFERQIAEFVGVNKAVCLNSQTACAEMALRVLGVGEGKSKKDAEQVAAKCALDKKM